MILASYLVVAGILIFLVFLMLTYVLAVFNRHVTPLLPYISYTGNFPVESCFFSLTFNYCSAFFICMVTLRFIQIKNILDNSSEARYAQKQMNNYNLGSLACGLAGGFGLSVIGSFQQKNAQSVHLAGFFLATFMVFVYIFIQTYLSFTCLSLVTSKKLQLFRMVLVIACFIILLFTPCLYIYNFIVIRHIFISNQVFPLFEESWVRILGALLEWCLLNFYVLFTASYFFDFTKVNGMELLGSHVILLVSFFFPATMFTTFTVAVCAKHVYPVMPFISYTGDRPIESCIFSLSLNIIAFLYIIILFIRYSQIIKFCEVESPPHAQSILRMNRVAIVWGFVSAIGLSITGSFQELHLASIHRMGALICTYCGFIYFWYQTVISDLLKGKLNTKGVAWLRTALSFASTTIHIIAPVLVVILDLSYPKCHEDTLLWSIEEDGWHLHVCCSFLEWCVFFINVTYIASFYCEFENIKIRKDEIIFLRPGHPIQEPTGPSRQRKFQ